ncbi:MAG: hypothetical protein NT045_02590 [Candidatus Aureabacteria bacterium]|nr:hypothetical protein [Candidatus Auribacterota bacterium]
MNIRVYGILAVICGVAAGCAAVTKPYNTAAPAFHVCSVKREDKLLAIDGQSRLVESTGINSQASRNSGKFTGLGGLDKWRYEARFLPPNMQGEEYVVVFDAKGPEAEFSEPLAVKFEYMYPKGIEVHYSQKVYERLPRGRHKYVWKNLGSQNEQNGDIASWRVSLNYRGSEVASMHSALWRPWGKVVRDE